MPERPTRDQVTVFPDAAAFRAWLEAHHADTPFLFVGSYKKAAGKSAMTYDEAVLEALCFGWIDGITYKVDDELVAVRYSPRRKGSNWSATNITRVGELTAAGRMRPAGRRAFEARTAAKTGIYSYENRPRDLPPVYARRLRANAAAWAFWQTRTPSFRRNATWWVVNAKQEATRERHLERLIANLANGEIPLPLRPIGRE